MHTLDVHIFIHILYVHIFMHRLDVHIYIYIFIQTLNEHIDINIYIHACRCFEQSFNEIDTASKPLRGQVRGVDYKKNPGYALA